MYLIPNEGDFVLASFPRSGNTWLRFILANLMAGGGEEITFHNYHLYVPDIHVIGDGPDWRRHLPFPRIIKSHLLPRPEDGNVIYIVRDPRAALLSYWHYEGRPGAFAEYVMSDSIWPAPWGEHVARWLEHAAANNVLLMRYEDWSADPLAQARRLLAHLGVDGVDDCRIRQAIGRSDFRAMRRIEEEKGFWRPLRGERFVRAGRVNAWQDELSPSEVEQIVLRNHAMMRYFDYI